MSYRYDKVYQQLSVMLISGKYPPGSKFPNEIELARQMNVARVTLRSALNRLENERRIVRSRSKGTVVYSNSECVVKVLILSEIFPEHVRQNPCLYIASGIDERCRELGWEQIHLTPDLLPAQLPEDRKISGMIINAHNFNGNEPLLDKLHRLAIPVVAVHGYAHDPGKTGFTTVMVHYREAWEDGVIHLKRMGHRRIAFLNLSRKLTFPRLNMTERQMMKIIAGHGLSVEPDLFYYDNQLEKHLPDIVRQWRKMQNPPTAAFCFSDYFADKLYAVLRRNRLSIPEDLAVLGFGGNENVEFMKPPLSTVDFGYNRMGRIAVDTLAAHVRWEHSKVKPVVYSPHQVAVRTSTEQFISHFDAD